MRWRVGLSVVVLAVAAAAGCGTDTTGPGEESAGEARARVAGGDSTTAADVAAVVGSLNRFWEVVDADLGFAYEPVRTERVSDGTDGATCDGRPVEEAEVDQNAYVEACREGILVAYDPDFVDDSDARLAMTLAHEWGHVVQEQAPELDLSAGGGFALDAELQADCFAGAWAASAYDGDIASARADVADSGDPSDVDIDDPDAHGAPEDRVAAFDVGFDGGAVACVEDPLLAVLPE